MARSDRKRLWGLAMMAAAVPLVVACNAIIGLSDFEKTECNGGGRCGDGGVPPIDGNMPDVVVDGDVPDVRGADPVSWAAWPMPNYDGGATPPLPRPIEYNVLDKDRVEDKVTGLVWRRATIGTMGYDAAKLACGTLEASGLWRLPKRIELVTLLDFGSPLKAPQLYLIGAEFGDGGVKNGPVWTSSEYRVRDLTNLDPDRPSIITDSLWTIDFKTGVVDALPRGDNASVLCVRAK